MGLDPKHNCARYRLSRHGIEAITSYPVGVVIFRSS